VVDPAPVQASLPITLWGFAPSTRKRIATTITAATGPAIVRILERAS
jgi:hypothetical protein